MLGFESLVKNCPAIESIDLEASKVVTDSVVLCLILNLPRLRVLKLEKCTSLTNVCLDFLLNFGTLLRVRILTSTPHFIYGTIAKTSKFITSLILYLSKICSYVICIHDIKILLRQ